jgi:hypothetical protein
MRPRTTENSCLAQENPRNLAGLLAERSGGGFASSPDVPASALGPRIIDSLHAGCRIERETSGLAELKNLVGDFAVGDFFLETFEIHPCRGRIS